MLVLSRQRDETIMIGDVVEITIVDIRGDKVRLGINAPPHVAVHRKEVYEAIKAENQRAAQAQDADLGTLASAIRPGRRAGLRPAGRIATPKTQPDRPATKDASAPPSPRTASTPASRQQDGLAAATTNARRKAST